MFLARHRPRLAFVPAARDTSNDRRSRFRLAVHAAHRAPPARAVGLLGDPAADDVRRRRSRGAKPAGIILSGGPKSVSEPGAPRRDPAILALGTPTLGICYGMQLMTDTLGGQVERGAAPRVRARGRRASLDGAPLFDDLPGVAARSGPATATSSRPRRPASTSSRRRPTRRWRPCRTRPPALRPAVPSRSRAHRAAAIDILRNFALRRLRLHAATGRWRRSWTRASARIRDTGRRRARRLRAVGRRRLDGRGRAAAPRASATG